MMVNKKNVYGQLIRPCCHVIKTGYFRDGYCRTDRLDYGRHVVCAVMTAQFLSFTKARGNDLSSPRPEFNFPGLNPGDRWCLCAVRWLESHQHHVAPPVILEACEQSALDIIPLDILEQHAFHLEE